MHSRESDARNELVIHRDFCSSRRRWPFHFLLLHNVHMMIDVPEDLPSERQMISTPFKSPLQIHPLLQLLYLFKTMCSPQFCLNLKIGFLK